MPDDAQKPEVDAPEAESQNTHATSATTRGNVHSEPDDDAPEHGDVAPLPN